MMLAQIGAAHSGRQGLWRCVPHAVPLAHSLAIWGHRKRVPEGSCEIVFHCAEHGYEEA